MVINQQHNTKMQYWYLTDSWFSIKFHFFFCKSSYYLQKNVILYEKQSGFRNNHSITHALLEIIDKIKWPCGKDQFVHEVILNLQKAFDTVDHTILLKKLAHDRIKGVVNKWFQSFLEDKK